MHNVAWWWKPREMPEPDFLFELLIIALEDGYDVSPPLVGISETINCR